MNLWNKTFKPMLLSEVDKAFNDKKYIYEVKYDGIRCLMYASNRRIKLISRNGVNITNTYPELNNISKNMNNRVIFDGEIVCLDDGKVSFTKLQQRNILKNINKINSMMYSNPVIYVCYDILYKDVDLTNLPLTKRKEILNNYKDTNNFIKTKYIDTNGIELFKLIKKSDIEGIVAKLKDSNYYINTRSKDWIKIKNYKKDIFYIGGYYYNDDNYIFSVLLGEKINNILYFVGSMIINKKNKIFKILEKEKCIKSEFYNFNKDNVKYVHTKFSCKVKYIERTINNHLRQPVLIEVLYE